MHQRTKIYSRNIPWAMEQADRQGQVSRTVNSRVPTKEVNIICFADIGISPYILRVLLLTSITGSFTAALPTAENTIYTTVSRNKNRETNEQYQMWTKYEKEL